MDTKTGKRHIAIVIVNWNGMADTAVCLNSIRDMKPTGAEITTIVVDNGSRDDSVSRLRREYTWAKLIALPENLGFTGGNNAGIREAMRKGAEFIWLLNNDTMVDSSAWRLVDAFHDPSVGVAGSKIYFAPGHEYHHDRYTENERGKVFWYAGGLLDWKNMYASHHGVDEVDLGQYDRTTETPFVSGCSMMIGRSVIERIGYFDERFYLYLEDLDYCLRAKQNHFRLVYYPKSVIWHVNAGSTGGAGNPLHEYYLTRNRLLIGLRYAPVRTKTALLREGIRFLVNGSPIKRRAVMDAVMGRWGKQYEPKKFA